MTNKSSDTLAALSAARMGWMTGQMGPVSLAGADELETSEAHLRLLAMDAQFRCLAAAPPVDLGISTPSDLVMPHAIYPPDHARDRFARLLAEAKTTEKVLLLRLLDRRGYIAHPFDFLPEVAWDGLPDLYAPLLAWQRSIAAGEEAEEDAPYPAYSRDQVQHQFRTLRSGDPAKAQAWLEAELKTSNAQQRLRLPQDLSAQFDQRDAA